MLSLLLFTEGQAIAARLNRQITKLNTKLRASIKMYNMKTQAITSTNLPTLTFEKAIDIDAVLWSQQSKDHDPAFYFKQRLFVLVCLSDRASEERNIVKEDLRTAKAFYTQELAKVQQAILMYPSSSRFDHGAVSALSGKAKFFKEQLDKCDAMAKHFQTDRVEIVEEEDEDWHDSDEESNYEDDSEEDEEGGIGEEEEEVAV